MLEIMYKKGDYVDIYSYVMMIIRMTIIFVFMIPIIYNSLRYVIETKNSSHVSCFFSLSRKSTLGCRITRSEYKMKGN